MRTGEDLLGAITTKEAAAHYAINTFEPRWRGLIEDAIACWWGKPPTRGLPAPPSRCVRDVAQFVDNVIHAANRLTIK